VAFSINDGPITVTRDGADIKVSWITDHPAGAWYQVYVNGKLFDWTTNTYVHMPMPSSRATFAIGVVDAAADRTTDHSSSLPGMPSDQALLTWYAGRFLAEDLSKFKIYASPSPGAAVDYTKAVATIDAFAGGNFADGFGRGPFGEGGFGRSARKYQWISDHLAGGLWRFVIRSVDIHGNENTNTTSVSITIIAPPEPPARDTDGKRLHYPYSESTKQVTLYWLASPSAA
jgi:hypothetical protein